MCPRELEQLVGLCVVQPSVEITHVSGTVVDARTDNTWAGVPTRMTKEDQGPSLPSLRGVSQDCM